MLDAMRRKDAAFEGRFVTAVKTTGIFCRPTCSVRPALAKNVEFFASPRDAMLHGYRACKRCKPLDPLSGAAFAPVVGQMLSMIEEFWPQPVRMRHLIERLIPVASAQRAFARHTGLSFAAYQRAKRLGAGLSMIRKGKSMTSAQAASGFRSSSAFREALHRLLGDQSMTNAAVLHAGWIESPLGPMIGVIADLPSCRGLVTLDWIDRKGLERELIRVRARLGRAVQVSARLGEGGGGGSAGGPLPIIAAEHELLDLVRGQLAECFAGTRREFSVPLATGLGTDFQERVWGVLRTIPPGTTRSYGEQARLLGNANAVRAVALANGANFRSIIIPCHRVIGADGSMTGYGGGVERKRWLLELERRVS